MQGLGMRKKVKLYYQKKIFFKNFRPNFQKNYVFAYYFFVIGSRLFFIQGEMAQCPS